jgi:hypothetical protein
MERMVEKALTSFRALEPEPLDCIHICLGFASPSGLPAAGCLPSVGSRALPATHFAPNRKTFQG